MADAFRRAPDREHIESLVARLKESVPQLAADEEEAFVELASQGPHPAQALLRHPADLAAIVRDLDRLRTVDELRSEIDATLTLEQTMAAVRGLKRRESLRVFLREVRGVASVRETVAEVAAIAEACLQATVAAACAEVDPSLHDHFCVIGMGKLGGRELNFSSDVDLIYVCSDDANANQEGLQRIARLVTRAMDETTKDGYVFRVDLRLRPEGRQGPLVPSMQAITDYYLNYGRTWERSAWTKARAVAGNLELGATIIAGLEPFIYRKSLDFAVLEELRAMKEKINANAQLAAVTGAPEPPPVSVVEPPKSALSSRLKNRLAGQRSGIDPHRRPNAEQTAQAASQPPGPVGWDVKIGTGGIREIEFFVQALQLVHSGVHRELRVRNTLEALDRLLHSGLISHDDHRLLADAYDFHRRVEHRVQMESDRQTHRLPSDAKGLSALAVRLEMELPEFQAAVTEHRTAVETIFDRLFQDPTESPNEATLEAPAQAGIDSVVDANVSTVRTDAIGAELGQLGFEKPRQVAGQLEILKDKDYGPFSVHASGASRELGRNMLREAAATPNPDQAFAHLARFLAAVGNRPGYWRMLSDSPHALRLLLHLFGSSDYLSSSLIRDPNIFERLVGVGSIAVHRTKEDIAKDLSSRIESISDPAHRMGVVRRFHREETLRIGLHETGGATQIHESVRQLSMLAEVIIEGALSEVYEPLRTRRRRPGSSLPPLEEIPFAVVAMGNLGGRELGFGSDLDILFVYKDDRQFKLEHTFYARLAQRLIRTLTSASEDGRMYEVDTRLRPSGNQGALVVSADAFEHYHREVAQPWESQALLRGRPLAGPESLCQHVLDVRQEYAFGKPRTDAMRAEFSAMRGRIRDAMYEAGSVDVKFGSGGIVDIEFASQFLQLTSSYAPGPQTDQSTRTALSAQDAATLGCEPNRLIDVFDTLRRVQARLRIANLRGTSILPSSPREREVLARRTGYQGANAADALMAELEDKMQLAASVYDCVIGT